MKKIFTLAFMAFFCSLGMMAQVVLGDIKFSLGEGKKINPANGKIVITFPNVSGVEDPTTTTFMIDGSFTTDEVEPSKFDKIEGTFAEGITLELSEFELQPSTAYALNITSVMVDGTELAADTTYVLNFKTRGAERKLSWAFQTDEATEAIITELIGTGENDYWKYVTKGPRIQSKVKFVDQEVTIDGKTVFPFLEDLSITTASSDCMLLGGSASSSYNRLHLAKKGNKVVIPDCCVGDVIDIKFGYVDTKSEYSLQIPGTISESATNEAKDSVPSPKSPAVYRFESQIDGDLTVYVNNSVVLSINITPGQPKVPRNYSVEAQYKAEGSEAVTLKTLVEKMEGTTGSIVETNHPYWVADNEGNAYTYGTPGSPMKVRFNLSYSEELTDTVFAVNYKKTDYEGVVYLSEGEDIEGSILCTSPNAAVRSSMGKAAYVMEDTKLVTLQPGTYKIRAILFDAGKTPGYVCVFSKGATENDEISLTANATNWTEAESDLLTITEATDIKLLSGGSDNTGLDVVMIYKSDDAPEDPQGITEVNAGAQKMAARKLMKEGKILIQTEAGTVNVAGQLVK